MGLPACGWGFDLELEQGSAAWTLPSTWLKMDRFVVKRSAAAETTKATASTAPDPASSPAPEKSESTQRAHVLAETSVKIARSSVTMNAVESAPLHFLPSEQLQKIYELEPKVEPVMLRDIEAFAAKFPLATEDMVDIVVGLQKHHNEQLRAASTSVTVKSMANVPPTATGKTPEVSAHTGFPSPDEAGFVLPQVMCLQPRGKHDIEISSTHLFLRAKKIENSILVPLADLERFFILPMEEKYQKQMVTTHVFRFKSPIQIGKLQQKHLVLNFKTKLTKPVLVKVGIDPSKLPPKVQGAPPLLSESEVVQETLVESVVRHMLSKKHIFSSTKDVFVSHEGLHFVKCYLRVAEGFVFPLSCGIFYLNKPFLFLPAEEMVGLEQGRAGGGRTMDFIVTMEDETVHEFSMIRNEEKPCLSQYMQYIQKKILKHRASEAASPVAEGLEKEGAAGGGSAEDQQDDSATDDEEVAGGNTSDEGSDFDLKEAEEEQSSSGEEDSESDISGEDDEADEDDEETLGAMDSATDDDEETVEHPHKKQKLVDV